MLRVERKMRLDSKVPDTFSTIVFFVRFATQKYNGYQKKSPLLCVCMEMPLSLCRSNTECGSYEQCVKEIGVIVQMQ